MFTESSAWRSQLCQEKDKWTYWGGQGCIHARLSESIGDIWPVFLRKLKDIEFKPMFTGG